METEFKKQKKPALGRGLDALIPSINLSESPPSNDYFQCAVDLIRPNPFQPRIRFSEEELQELADSIQKQGLLQPIVIRRNGTAYELAAGERRLRAAKLAGLTQVPVLVKDLSDAKLLELSIVENIQRQDLNPIEEAEAYHRLSTEFNLTQEQIAERVGKSRPSIANYLRLRQLPESIKDTILNGSLSMGHAKVLLSAETPAIQLEAWRCVMEKGLSVRETELLLKRLHEANHAPVPPPPSSEDTYYQDLSEKLTQRFGTKVLIKRQGKKGKVEIEFYNDKDLERLLNLLSA